MNVNINRTKQNLRLQLLSCCHLMNCISFKQQQRQRRQQQRQVTTNFFTRRFSFDYSSRPFTLLMAIRFKTICSWSLQIRIKTICIPILFRFASSRDWISVYLTWNYKYKLWHTNTNAIANAIANTNTNKNCDIEIQIKNLY